MCVIFTWYVPQVNKTKLAKYVLRSVSLSPVQILPIKCEFFPKLLKLHEQEDIPSYILYHRYYYCICTFFAALSFHFFIYNLSIHACLIYPRIYFLWGWLCKRLSCRIYFISPLSLQWQFVVVAAGVFVVILFE